MSNTDYLDTPKAQRIAARLTEEDLIDLSILQEALRNASEAVDEGDRVGMSDSEMLPLRSAERDAFDEFYIACECLGVSGRFVTDLLDRRAGV